MRLMLSQRARANTLTLTLTHLQYISVDFLYICPLWLPHSSIECERHFKSKFYSKPAFKIERNSNTRKKFSLVFQRFLWKHITSKHNSVPTPIKLTRCLSLMKVIVHEINHHNAYSYASFCQFTLLKTLEFHGIRIINEFKSYAFMRLINMSENIIVSIKSKVMCWHLFLRRRHTLYACQTLL